jgi:hypothetical protein
MAAVEDDTRSSADRTGGVDEHCCPTGSFGSQSCRAAAICRSACPIGCARSACRSWRARRYGRATSGGAAAASSRIAPRCHLVFTRCDRARFVCAKWQCAGEHTCRGDAWRRSPHQRTAEGGAVGECPELGDRHR